MSLLRLFYLSLVSPGLAIFEVERAYQLGYLFLGFLGFTISQASLLICSSIIDHSPLYGGTFFIDLCGSVLTGAVQITLMVLIIHVTLSRGVDVTAFPRMMTTFFLAQIPFSYLVCFSIMGKSMEVFAQNSTMGLTFFLVLSALVFAYVVFLLGKGIQIHYRAATWVKSFTILVIALFVTILMQFVASAGFVLTLIGSLYHL